MEPSEAISEYLEPRLLSLGFTKLADGKRSQGYWAFQLGDLKVALALDPRNSELGISLVDRRSDRLIEFWLFGEIVGDPEAAKMGSIVLTRDGSAAEVGNLASVIERHISVLSNWNSELAEWLFIRQLEISDAAWRKQRLSDALKLADTYWQSKDYVRFAQLLAPFRNELSPATAKKVRYAERAI